MTKCKHEFYPIAFFLSTQEGLEHQLVACCAHCETYVVEGGERLNEEDAE